MSGTTGVATMGYTTMRDSTQRSFDDWDAYVSELENLNMQQLVDLANEAHERAQ